MKYSSLILSLFIFTSMAWSQATSAFKLEFNIDKELKNLVKKPATNHPDYPAYMLIKQLTAKKQSPKRIIQQFEKLMNDKQFKVLVEADNQHSLQLKLGAKGSFSLWRDLFNLTLGKAYYEKGDKLKAKEYFSHIQPNSTYYAIAGIFYNFSCFELEKIELAKLKLAEIESLNNSEFLKDQLRLQKAYLHNTKKEFRDAIDLLDRLSFKSMQLENFKKKVLAQAYFGDYTTNQNSMSFQSKVVHLDILSSIVESIPVAFRDGKLSYLASEAYWHKAVAYRLEEPVANEKIWHKQLRKADEWISPFVNKSIKHRQAFLPEEAYFFSIALLWERGESSLGLKRLIHLNKIYPQGIYREDSYQLLGDYYFDKNNFKKSVFYYRKLAQVGSQSKASYGVYKAAWSFYNMEEKWKALRHFERLFEYYQSLSPEDRLNKAELAKESRQDLLLTASEILNSKKGIKELDVFKLNTQERILMIQDLAKSYHRIGSFKNEVKTLEYLLKDHISHENSHEWLVSLIKSFYADGKRKDLSLAMSRYYPKWKPSSNNETNKYVFDEWGKIILSLHKEARKTDDKRYWRATDLAYKTYEKLNPNGVDGNIWYYGAQKFEKQEKLWQSITWYQKAALLPDFKQKDDAALTLLGLIHNQTEELSIIEDKSKGAIKYKKTAEIAKWFINEAPENLDKQKHLAKLIYLESNHYLNQVEEIKNFLSLQLNNYSPKQWNLFLAQNNRLYQEKNWKQSYELNTHLYTNGENIPSEKKKMLLNLRQETSFQLGFESSENKEKMREWYKNAFSMQDAPRERTIKAWHNYLLSYKTSELDEFEQELKSFENSYPEAKGAEEAKLQYNIMSAAIKHFNKSKQFYKKSLYLPKASNFSDDVVTKEDMNWEALVLSVAYSQHDRFDVLYKRLQEKKSPYLNKVNNQVFLAKSYLYRNEYKKSWNLAQKLISNKTPPAVWTLLIDNFRFAGSDTKEAITSYMKNNQEKLKNNDLLKPLWGRIYQESFNDNYEKLMDKNFDRKPASIKEGDSEKVVKLKEKLNDVSNTISEMNYKKKQLNSSVIKWIPQTALSTACKAPELTQNYIEKLVDIKDDKIDSPQWTQFVNRVEIKVSEFKKIKSKEEDNCEKLTNELVFFGNFKKSYTPFCDNEDCLFEKSLDESDIIAIEKNWFKKNSKETLSKFMHFLSAGSFTQAEFIAANEKEKEKQVFMYGLIRLAMSDYWNSYSIMLSFKKHPKWWPVAQEVLKKMAYKKNNRSIASKYQQPKGAKFIDLLNQYLK